MFSLKKYKIKKFIIKYDYNNFKKFFLKYAFSQKEIFEIYEFIMNNFNKNSNLSKKYISFIFNNTGLKYFIHKNDNFSTYFKYLSENKEEDILISILNNYSFFINSKILTEMFFISFNHDNINVMNVFIENKLINFDKNFLITIFKHMKSENFNDSKIIPLSKHLLKDEDLIDYINWKNSNLLNIMKNKNKIDSF